MGAHVVSVGGRMRWSTRPAAILSLLCLSAPASAATCLESFASTAHQFDTRLTLKGDGETRVDLPPAGGADTLLYAVENGVDVELEVHDATGAILARADSPVARIGRQRLFFAGSGKAASFAIVRGREHPGVTGSVRLLMIRLAAPATGCTAIERAVAAADQAYAAARSNARTVLESAAAQYEKAAATLDVKSRAEDLGDLQLTLAALDYYELQDWAGSAAVGRAVPRRRCARRTVRTRTRARRRFSRPRGWSWPRRHPRPARAPATPRRVARLAGQGAHPADAARSLSRARVRSPTTARCRSTTSVSRYRTTRRASSLPSTTSRRRAPSSRSWARCSAWPWRWRTSALCEWGLGRLSAALPMFDQALALMTPQPYPDLYLATLYSSALAHYAAGRFDDSLRLQRSGARSRDPPADGSRARAQLLRHRHHVLRHRRSRARRAVPAQRAGDPDAGRGCAQPRGRAARARRHRGRNGRARASSRARFGSACGSPRRPPRAPESCCGLATDYAAQGDAGAALTVLDSLANIPAEWRHAGAGAGARAAGEAASR